MNVVWLISVQDQLQDVLAKATDPVPTLPALLDELSHLLCDTFVAARAIIVIERINGYSGGLKNHVLRVEYVDEKGESHAAIVKFSTGEKLERELAGWQSCARPSKSRGVVLMPLLEGARSADGRLRTLVYEDARQRLRAAQLVNLESAVLTCCRWDDPKSATVQYVFEEIFQELHSHLYQRAHGENEPETLARELQGRLQKSLAGWTETGSLQDSCRTMALTVLPGIVPDLVDPLDYLPGLLNRRRHLPEVMRGCAHGDLHGRNILAGLGGVNATFAAVFDYEDMGDKLLLGWDFAKLETELKVRTYKQVFRADGKEEDFIEHVLVMEQQLATETLRRNRSSAWSSTAEQEKPAVDPESPAGRLFALLIALRGHARNCLGGDSQRSNSWLHEYFFLLAAYGLYAGKFSETYERRHFLAAYVAAASAGAQHAWAKNAAERVTEKAAARARIVMNDGTTEERPEIDDAESHHVPFAFARTFCRSRDVHFIHAGIAILSSLRIRFTYALEVWQELALAHLELLDLTRDETHLVDAKRVLLEIDIKYPRRRHLETLSRHGRLHKDCGHYAFDKGDQAAARHHYQEAIKTYLQAYNQAKNYYPGINAATLYLLAGQPGPSLKLAGEILTDLEQNKQMKDDDRTWVLATMAEANLLLGNCDDAALLYEQAVDQPDFTPHHRSAMRKQVERILRVKPGANAKFDAERLERIFQPGE